MVLKAASRGSNAILYICGNYPLVLPSIERNPGVFQVRRVLNPWQAMKVLEESDHSLVFFEHDPLIYDGVPGMCQLVAQACREYAGCATIVLFYHCIDPLVSAFEPFARRVTVIKNSPEGGKPAEMENSRQTTLEGC